MAASITGVFTIIDRASGPMRKMEAQALKTMAAIEGVGKAQDRAAGSHNSAGRQMEDTARKMKTVENAAKATEQSVRKSGDRMDDHDRKTRNLGNSLERLGNKLGQINNIFRFFGAILGGLKIAGLAVGIAVLGQAIGALAGGAMALIPALGQASGVIAAMPQTIMAAVQGFGVFKAALSGVGDALKAGMQMQQQGARVMQDSAQAHIQAVHGVKEAEYGLMTSQRGVTTAQQALTQARRDAIRNLQDLKLAAIGADISQQRSVLSLREARRALAEAAVQPGTTDLQMEDLRLGVSEARLGVRQSKLGKSRAHEDLNRERRRGAGGNLQVVAAENALTDAMHSQENAVYGLQQAQVALRNEMTRGSGIVDTYRQAMANLSPPAQAFVEKLMSMRPALKRIQAESAAGLFPGLGRSLDHLKAAFPMLERLGFRTGRVMGREVERASSRFTSKSRLSDLEGLGNQNATITGRMIRGASNLGEALLDFMVAARPFTDWITRTIVLGTEWVARWSRAKRQNGDFADALDRTKDRLRQFGRIFRDLWVTIGNVFKAAKPLGDRLWAGAERGAKNMREWTDSAEGMSKMRDWFNKLYAPLHELGQLTKDLAIAWAHLTTAPGLTETTKTLRRYVPDLEGLFKSLAGLGPSAATVLGEFVRVLNNMPIPVLQVMVDLLANFLKLINLIMEKVPGASYALSGLLLAGALSKSISMVGTLYSKWVGLFDLWRRAPTPPGGVTPVPGGGPGGKFKAFVTGAAGRAGLAIGAGLYGASKLDKAADARTDTFDMPKSPTGIAGFATKHHLWSNNKRESTWNIFEKAKDEGPLRRFGDSAEKMARQLNAAGDSQGLRRLAKQAETFAKEFPKYSKQLDEFADSARAAAAKWRDGRLYVAASAQLRGLTRITRTNVHGIVANLNRMTPGARTAARNSLIAMSRQMERSGLLPRGSTRELVVQIDHQLKGLERAGRRRTKQMVDSIAAGITAAFPRIGALGKGLAEIAKGLQPKELTGRETLRRYLNMGSQNPGAQGFGDMFFGPRNKGEERQSRVLAGRENVMRFQRNKGLTADGIIGPATAAAAKQAGVILKIADDTNKKVEQGHRRTRKATRDTARGTKDDVSTFWSRLRKNVLGDNDDVESNSRRKMRSARAGMRDHARGARKEVGDAFDGLRSDALKALRAMGLTAGEARNALSGKSTTTDSKSEGGTDTGAAGDHRNAAYGLRVRYAGGGRIRGLGLHDNVAIAPGHMAAPGELIVNRHTEDRINRKLAGKTTLGAEVAGETRPHHAALDEMRNHRMPIGFGRGGRMVRVPGDPDTTGGRDKVNAAIVNEVASWIRRYHVQIGYGYDPGHHQSPGHNVTGTAIDVVPGAGGNWDSLEAGLKAALRAGKRVLYGTHGVGTPWPGHGRGNHAHIEWGGGGAVPGRGAGGGAGLGVDPISLKRRKTRLGAVPGAMSQRGMDVYRTNLENVVNEAIGAGGGAGSGAVQGSKNVARAIYNAWQGSRLSGNREALLSALETALVEANMTNPRGGDRDSVGAFQQRAPWGSFKSRMDVGESAGRFFQRWRDVGTAGQSAQRVQVSAFPGKYDQRKGDALAWMDRLGVDTKGLELGGRVGWGGWNAKGGTFNVDRPTLFGAGEGGQRETVSISRPGDKNTGRRPVQIHIANIENHRPGDIRKIVEQELEGLAGDLDLVGMEED